MLGWMEILQRYRRSALGPFWLTISSGVLIGCLGPLYGRLLSMDLATYFPYLAISFIVWMYIGSLIIESCNAFIGGGGFITQLKLPLSVHILRNVWKNLLIFAHNVVIVLLVLLFYPPPLSWELFLAPLGIFFIAINGIWSGILLGLLCTRFRDVSQIVGSLMQIMFFLTPIIWKVEMLGKNQWIAQWNPFYHFMETVRGPLVGSGVNILSWTIVLGITVVGFMIAIVMFGRFRNRIVYWV